MKDSVLQEYLAEYKHPVTTKSDVLSVLNHYQGLRGKVENFVFDNGTQQKLFCLDGTIPVQFRGNSYQGGTYNIPVCVWLMLQHPMHAPMVFVRPTQAMRIEVSRHVDHNGKVYLPYLSDWKDGTSDLIGLIQVLVVVFSERPPVFMAPKSPHQPAGPTSLSQAPPYSMPGLPGYPASSPFPYPTPPQSSVPLPYPLKPPVVGAYLQPPLTASAGATPPYPTSGGFVSPFPAQPGYPQQLPMTGAAGGVGATATITEDHIRASLLSAVEDKVRRRVREQQAQVQAELHVLANTQGELQQSRQQLEAAGQQLHEYKTALEERVSVLRAKNGELQASVDKLSDNQQLDIDEAVLATAPLYKQLLTLCAEENATQDAIYHLGEAQERGVIDLSTLLKHCRVLSRRQFVLRATIQRCRKRAGLAC